MSIKRHFSLSRNGGHIAVQGGLWGHDLAHHQVLSSERWYYPVGVFFWNLVLGVSFSYWNYKHNRHHAHPNVIGKDGDIHFSALWFTPVLTRGINWFQKQLLPYQQYYFLPLLVFAYVVPVFRSIGYLFFLRGAKSVIEGALLVLHHGTVWYLFFLAFSFPQALALLGFYYALLGLYMGLIFSPGHSGMPMILKEETFDYVHKQITTTRNITPGLFNDVLYGGLNYQIEHHLFPTMPRNNLRKARTVVREFCDKHGIAYHETGTIAAFREILSELGRVAHTGEQL